MEPRGRAVPSGTATSPESAVASELFDQFVSAGTFKSVLFTYRQICDVLRLKPTNIPNFYPRLKAKLHSWRAASLWAKLDKRASHKCYNRGKACPNTRVLIIGAGPCGLRAAIEAQLLGSKVVVVEKRDRFSRNNVLHLWPFVIHDLRNLGAKKFFGKFCAGSIDHISIRQLQLILLKVALLLGVEVHENVGFESLIEPPEDQSQEKIGWHARVSPPDHPVSQYEFDVLIGADGKRNTLLGFNRKEFRGKLAIAVTANFINRHTIEEARVPEISGVAFIFNQKFFQDMREQTAIDLENIVYYKDDTHYFVMTAKKQSLLERRVIIRYFQELKEKLTSKECIVLADFAENYTFTIQDEIRSYHWNNTQQDYNDTARLLAPENVDREALMEYARDAADFATNYQLPSLDFAVNHYGQADVAMFDFTSMYAAENACRIIERRGHKLLQGLVGDSLLEPFWPTGSGCARGFLSSFDAAWMIRSWSSGKLTTLQVLAEREAIYRLLAQTTPENLSKDLNQYTLNPCSRYPNLNLQAVLPSQVRSLFNTDSKIEESILDVAVELPKKKRRRESMIHPDTLLNWCQKQVALNEKIKIQDFTSSWKNGLALCAILHRYRPDLIDITALDPENVAKNNQLAFDICERELCIPPIMTGQEMAECEVPDKLSMVSYISQVYESFRGEIPVVSYSNSGEERNVSPNRHHGTPLSVLNRIASRLQSKRKYSIEKESKDRERGENIKKRSSLLTHKRRSKERANALDLGKQDVILTDYKSLTPAKPRESINTRVKNLEEKLKRDAGLRCHMEEIECSKAARVRSEQTELNIKLLQEQLQKNGSENAKKVRTPKVGKLRKDEWNAKIFEEKSRQQNAVSKSSNVEKPPIFKDIFVDKVQQMSEKLKSGGMTASEEARFKQFDEKLHKLQNRLTKGNLEAGDKGHNQTAAMAEHMTTIWDKKVAQKKDPLPPAPVSKPRAETDSSTSTAGSEICYFCKKHVYLMERLSAEGLFFHRSCFKCEYCSASLRRGNYSFDRDAFCGGKFYCIDHFRKQKPDHRTQEILKRKEAFLSCALEEQQKEQLYKTLLDNTEKALSPNKPAQTSTISTPTKDVSKNPEEQKPDKLCTPSNLLAEPSSSYGRDQTPERVEYENSIMEMSEEELLTSELEEEELTQKNLGPSQDLATSEDEYSDLSTDTESDEEAFAEELERSLTADETRKLAETWNRKYSAGHSLIQSDSASSSSSSSSSADDEGSETEIGTDTSDDIDSDAEYSVENSEGSDKPKTGEEVADPIKTEVKDEFTVEVPVIDLKSMNKISDDESNSDSELSEEISDSEEHSEESETGTEVDSESEPKAPLPPPQIPTIIIHESPPQDVDLDQKWDAHDPSTTSTEVLEDLPDEVKVVNIDESLKETCIELSSTDLKSDETIGITDKDNLADKNTNDGKLNDTDKNFDLSCFRTDNEEIPKTQVPIIKFPVVAPLATEESSSDISVSSGVNSLAKEIVTDVIDAAKETVLEYKPDNIENNVQVEGIADSSISEKTTSSEKLKNYSMLKSSSSSSGDLVVIDLCSPERSKLENLPIVDLCSPLTPEIELVKEKFESEKIFETVPFSKPDILSNVPLLNINTSNFDKDVSVIDLTVGLNNSMILTEIDQTILLDDSAENILDTSITDQFVVDKVTEKPIVDESFITIRKKRKYSDDEVFNWDSDNDVSIPMCYSAIQFDEETDLSKDGIYHANVVQTVDAELAEQLGDESVEEVDTKIIDSIEKIFIEDDDRKFIESPDIELVEKVGIESVEQVSKELIKQVTVEAVNNILDYQNSPTCKFSNLKAKPVSENFGLENSSNNFVQELPYKPPLFSHELKDAKLSASVPKGSVFTASSIKSLSDKKDNSEQEVINHKSSASIDASDIICDKSTEENISKSLLMSDEKPKASKGISPKEETKYKGYSGSFAEKVRPKSLFCDTLYLRSLDIKLKQSFPDLAKSNDKINDNHKPEHHDKIAKKLFSDSNDSLDIDEKDNDVFESVDENKSYEDVTVGLQGKLTPAFLKDETDEEKPKISAHKHPSVSFSTVEAYSDLVSPYTSAQVTTDNNFPTKMRPKCDIDINRLRQKREKRKSVHEDIQGLPFADEEKIVSPVDPLGNSDVFMTPKATFDTNSKDNSKSSESDVFSTPAWKTPDLVDEERYLRLQSTAEQEKARQEARARARLKSDEELGLSPNNYRKKYKRQLSLNSINYDELCSDEFYDQEDEIEDDIINNFCQGKISGIEETFSMFKNSDLFHKGKNSEHPSTSSQQSPLKIFKGSLQDDLSLLGSNLSPPIKAMSASTGTLKFNDTQVQIDTAKSASVLQTSMHSSKPNSPETSPDIICTDTSPFDSKFSYKGKGKSIRTESSGDEDKSKSNGKKSIFSILNFGKGNLSKEKPKQKPKEPEKELSSSLPNDFGARSVSKSKPFSHLKLSKSKEKTTKPPKAKPVPSDDVPCSPLENSSVHEEPLTLSFNIQQAKIIPKYAVYRNPETMISTFPVHLPVPKLENGLAPKASEDSFSDEDDTKGNKASHIPCVEKNDKSINEKEKKAQRIVQKVQRQQVLKRLRNAQEIQRRLEELEVEQRDLECRGVELEKMFRGERHEGNDKKGEADLMQEWYTLLHTKNKLMREEQELLIRLKDLELEDRQSKLQQDMRERMAQTDLKDASQIKKEREILNEMLEIVEKRNELVTMLDQLRLREMEEEKNIHSEVFTKGIKSPLSPVGKS